MTEPPQKSDALVLFGATGDLAYKKIFPSLERLEINRLLDVPIIGVAKSGWDIEKLRERVRASIKEHGRNDDQSAIERLLSRRKDMMILQMSTAYCSPAFIFAVFIYM